VLVVPRNHALTRDLGDIVALIGSCVYRRKHIQDEIRRRNGSLLLLQACSSVLLMKIIISYEKRESKGCC